MEVVLHDHSSTKFINLFANEINIKFNCIEVWSNWSYLPNEIIITDYTLHFTIYVSFVFVFRYRILVNTICIYLASKDGFSKVSAELEINHKYRTQRNDTNISGIRELFLNLFQHNLCFRVLFYQKIVKVFTWNLSAWKTHLNTKCFPYFHCKYILFHEMFH